MVIVYILGNKTLRCLLIDKIKHLVVEIEDETTIELFYENIFSLILSLCKQLVDLSFIEWLPKRRMSISIFKLPKTSCVSSTLTKLEIRINTFDDCLYLLDGRLEFLSTLIVDIGKISISRSNIDNTVSRKRIVR